MSNPDPSSLFAHQLSELQTPQPTDDLEAWIRGKTPAQLQAIEVHEPCPVCRGSTRQGEERCDACDGTGKAPIPTPLFPDALRYRDGMGKVCELGVYFKIPGEDDLGQATKDAVAYVAHLHKGKKVETPDQARELVGAMRFESYDNAAVVALCTRSRRAPHGREYMLHVLLKSIPPTTIAAAFERLSQLRRLWDVSVGELSEGQFWGFVKEVARVRNISPLGVLVPALQSAFIVRLAYELQASLTPSSSSGSSTG